MVDEPVANKQTADESENLTETISLVVEELNLSKSTIAVVQQLKPLEDQHKKLEWDFVREFCQLRRKYADLYKPLYEKRHTVLAKKSENEPDVTLASLGFQSPVGGSLMALGTQNVPGFWLAVLKRHRLVREHLQSHDEAILRFLEDITSEWSDENGETHSFRLIFKFAENPYFKNQFLTKTFNFFKSEEAGLLLDVNEDLLASTVGTTIEWHSENANVTKKVIMRKQKNKKTNQTRTIKESVDAESFFHFFDSHIVPTMEQLSEMDEAEVEHIEQEVGNDFEIGMILRDRMIPRAFGWFLGLEKDDDYVSDSEYSDSDYSSDSESSAADPSNTKQECAQQ